jgi:hypothetical protein
MTAVFAINIEHTDMYSQYANTRAACRARYTSRQLNAAPSPSPGTPGEGRGEGDYEFDGRWHSKSPTP